MAPTFKDGETTTFNKCLEGKKESLKVGTIILVEKLLQPEEIFVIRKKTGSGSALKYSVSTNQNPNSTKEVTTSEIKAVYEKK